VQKEQKHTYAIRSRAYLKRKNQENLQDLDRKPFSRSKEQRGHDLFQKKKERGLEEGERPAGHVLFSKKKRRELEGEPSIRFDDTKSPTVGYT
jgi:hypothetical protein